MPARKSILPTAPVGPNLPEAPTSSPVAAIVSVAPASSSTGPERPTAVTVLAVLTLISGIINISAGVGAAIGLALSVVLLCLAPLGLLPILLGVFEILYALKLLSSLPQGVRPNETIAILEICCFLIGNLLSTGVGILAMVLYNDPAVKAYFVRINPEGMGTFA